MNDLSQGFQLISLESTIRSDLHGLRLDQALAKLFPEYSRSRLQEWIVQEKVQVDGQFLKSKTKIMSGQSIKIIASIETVTSWQPQVIPLSIIYEDEALIVINKPPGLVVHPAAGNPDNTLVNAILHHAPGNAALPRGGIVHRLDKDTSGLLVVARSLIAHNSLITQLQTHNVQREYLAVVNGALVAGGTINAAIGRHPKQRTQMAVVDEGKPSVTHYRVVQRFQAHTLVRLSLETGRTHQIRVHMAHMGYPLVGDPVYGGRLKVPANASVELKQQLQHFKRQALHAHKLSFQHPITQEAVHFEAEIPRDFLSLITALST